MATQLLSYSMMPILFPFSYMSPAREKKFVSEKMAKYYNTCKTFTEVFYPRSIYDLVDYADRECVKREVKLRISKTVDAILFHWTHQRGILQLRFRRHGPHMQGDQRHPHLYNKKSTAVTMCSRNTVGSTSNGSPKSRQAKLSQALSMP